MLQMIYVLSFLQNNFHILLTSIHLNLAPNKNFSTRQQQQQQQYIYLKGKKTAATSATIKKN